MLTARERARRRVWRPSEQRVEILGTLSELFACEPLSSEAALRQAVPVLSELLGDAIVVHHLDARRRRLEPLAWHDGAPGVRHALDALGGRSFRADLGFTAGALDTGEAVLVPRVTPLEVELLQPEFAPIVQAAGIQGFAVAPMKACGILTGLLVQCRTRPEPPLEVDECRFLEEVALHLGLGLACPPAADPG